MWARLCSYARAKAENSGKVAIDRSRAFAADYGLHEIAVEFDSLLGFCRRCQGRRQIVANRRGKLGLADRKFFATGRGLDMANARNARDDIAVAFSERSAGDAAELCCEDC